MRSEGNHLPLILLSLGLAAAAVQLLAAAPGKSRPALASALQASSPDKAVLAKAYRFENGGWIYVHLEGSPHDIGYQHGYLLGPQIADAFAAISLQMTHSTQRDWDLFRSAARQMLWPKIDPEYQAELRGIADGLAASRVKLDLYDVVAMNAFEELPGYYVPWLNEQTHSKNAPKIDSPESCSAFVATGSWTKDGKIVMAHNNWTSYVNAVERCRPRHPHPEGSQSGVHETAIPLELEPQASDQTG